MIHQSKILPNLWGVKLDELRIKFRLAFLHNLQILISSLETADPINLTQQGFLMGLTFMKIRLKVMSQTELFITQQTVQALEHTYGKSKMDSGLLYRVIQVLDDYLTFL